MGGSTLGFARLVLRWACLAELNSGAKYQLGLPVGLLQAVAGEGEPELKLVIAIFFFKLKKKKVLKARETPGDCKRIA